MNTVEQTLWDEWVSFPPINPVEDEIAGIINGLPYTIENGYNKILCGRLFILRRLVKLYNVSKYIEIEKKALNKGDVIRFPSTKKRGKTVFCLRNDVATSIRKHSDNMGRRKRNWHWVRGIWGSCGSLYIPKLGYYLVLRMQPGSHPERLQTMLKSCGFNIAVRRRNGAREITLRDQQQIVTFLSKIGFVQTTLALEEMAIFRSVRNHANKLVNCDSANIKKSLIASQKQLRLIDELDRKGLTAGLPTQLKDLVETRRANPSVSLRELGELLQVPVSKSTIEYRWRKLDKLINM